MPDRTPATTDNARQRLMPVLGLFSATTVVVGEMIGSGIFMSPSQVAKGAGPWVGIILSLWLICGLVNLCGALALAELSAMFPQVGGTYVFLREAYGRLWSFLWCWAEFWVMRSGSIALLATYAALNCHFTLAALGWPIAAAWQSQAQKLISIGLILLLGAGNIAGTIWGSRVQNVLTTIKVGFVAIMAAFPFIAPGSDLVTIGPLWPSQFELGLFARLGIALAAIMWAYDGWGNITVLAAEVRTPEKTVPRALVAGVSLVTVLYVGINLAYHRTLSVDQIADTLVPAAAVAERLWPRFGQRVILSMLMISLAGALNGNILVGPRVLYAAACDHPLLGFFSRLSPRTRVPVRATVAICSWAIILILLGDITRAENEPLSQVLTSYCVFGGSIFYFSAVLAVFVMRYRLPDAPRPYRAWGYPVLPAAFLAFYLFLLANLYWTRPGESSLGLLFIAAGLVVYVVFARRERAAKPERGANP